jgi:hypothetical protein
MMAAFRSFGRGLNFFDPCLEGICKAQKPFLGTESGCRYLKAVERFEEQIFPERLHMVAISQ